MTTINEPITATVSFTPGKLRPLSFVWNNHHIRVEQTTFSWTTRQGRDAVIHFSVTANRTLYELIFNTHSLRWTLAQVSPEVFTPGDQQ